MPRPLPEGLLRPPLRPRRPPPLRRVLPAAAAQLLPRLPAPGRLLGVRQPGLLGRGEEPDLRRLLPADLLLSRPDRAGADPHRGVRAQEEELQPVEEDLQDRGEYSEVVGVHFGRVPLRPGLHRRGRHGPARRH